MKSKSITAITMAVLFVPLSYADVQFNGFASIRASQANSDGNDAPFPQFKEGEVSFKSESLFALQARADLTEGLSATVQLFAEGATDFDLKARWAYITYQIDDTHQVSAGRFANPIFHQSEYEKVGYAHNFSRLPKAVYTDFEFSTVEGISLDSSFDLDDYTLTTKLMYASWDGEVFLAATGANVPLAFDNIFMANATLSGDWWKVFAGGFMTEIDGQAFDSTVLTPFAQPGIDASGASATEISTFNKSIGWDGKDGVYLFAGFGIDYNDWLLDFEITDYGVEDSSDGINQTWYVALGKRIDLFTVTIHKEEFTQDTDFSVFNGVSNPILKATAQQIQSGLAAREFDGVGISLRYDFHPSAAFKFDYFKGEDTRASVGDYSIVSAGIDIVF